ncbi:MAG: T9SS type A sorting domain-containing protein, partial [Bacteroidales bacterium]|nr:T9SS type A sorting domain-containing protein [Bacteroidales bacterium]
DNNTLRISGNVNIDDVNNWENEGQSTVEFNGSDLQEITNMVGFGKMKFYNGKENKNAGDVIFYMTSQDSDNNPTTALANISIKTNATFTKGIVVVNTAEFGIGATSTGSSLASHMIGLATKVVPTTSNTNKSVEANNTAENFVFPVGSGLTYGGVEANVNKTSSVSYNYAEGHGFSTEEMPKWWSLGASSPFANVNNTEFWRIGGDLKDMYLNWEGGDNRFPTMDEEELDWTQIAIASFSNGWKDLGGTASSRSATRETQASSATTKGGKIGPTDYTGTLGNSCLALGSKSNDITLPIELTSFTATCNNSSVDIEWVTASEKNNDYFALERSNDAVNFVEIARIAGAGNSLTENTYNYTDYQIFGGDCYYRLIQVDFDGSSTASNIIAVNCVEEAGEPTISVYPNPFDEEFTLVLQNFNNNDATIEVYDILGRLVMTEKATSTLNEYETTVQLNNIPTGTYTVRVSTSTYVINQKVSKR